MKRHGDIKIWYFNNDDDGGGGDAVVVVRLTMNKMLECHLGYFHLPLIWKQ